MLLTRPPLSYYLVQVPDGNSARLACVRHAASVHPEPGSNSQIMYSRAFGSLFTRFFQLSVELNLARLCLLQAPAGACLTVQFSRSAALSSARRFAILSSYFAFVNTFLKAFFQVFSLLFRRDFFLVY